MCAPIRCAPVAPAVLAEGEYLGATGADALRAAYYRETLQHWTLGLARPEAPGLAGPAFAPTRAQWKPPAAARRVGGSFDRDRRWLG